MRSSLHGAGDDSRPATASEQPTSFRVPPSRLRGSEVETSLSPPAAQTSTLPLDVATNAIESALFLAESAKSNHPADPPPIHSVAAPIGSASAATNPLRSAGAATFAESVVSSSTSPLGHHSVRAGSFTTSAPSLNRTAAPAVELEDVDDIDTPANAAGSVPMMADGSPKEESTKEPSSIESKTSAHTVPLYVKHGEKLDIEDVTSDHFVSANTSIGAKSRPAGGASPGHTSPSQPGGHHKNVAFVSTPPLVGVDSNAGTPLDAPPFDPADAAVPQDEFCCGDSSDDDPSFVTLLKAAFAGSPNVWRMFLFTAVYNIGAAIVWSTSVWPPFLQAVFEDTTSLGWIASASGIMELVAAIISGFAADRIGRNITIRVASCVLLLACGGMAVGVLFESFPAIMVGSGGAGLSYGAFFPCTEALFADSVAPCQRTVVYTFKYAVEVGSGLIGVIMSLFMFLAIGNEWEISTMKIVILSGLSGIIAGALVLFSVSSKYALSEAVLTGEMSLEEEEFMKSQESERMRRAAEAAASGDTQEGEKKPAEGADTKDGTVTPIVAGGDVGASIGSVPSFIRVQSMGSLARLNRVSSQGSRFGSAARLNRQQSAGKLSRTDSIAESIASYTKRERDTRSQVGSRFAGVSRGSIFLPFTGRQNTRSLKTVQRRPSMADSAFGSRHGSMCASHRNSSIRPGDVALMMTHDGSNDTIEAHGIGIGSRSPSQSQSRFERIDSKLHSAGMSGATAPESMMTAESTPSFSIGRRGQHRRTSALRGVNPLSAEAASALGAPGVSEPTPPSSPGTDMKRMITFELPTPTGSAHASLPRAQGDSPPKPAAVGGAGMGGGGGAGNHLSISNSGSLGVFGGGGGGVGGGGFLGVGPSAARVPSPFAGSSLEPPEAFGADCDPLEVDAAPAAAGADDDNGDSGSGGEMKMEISVAMSTRSMSSTADPAPNLQSFSLQQSGSQSQSQSHGTFMRVNTGQARRASLFRGGGPVFMSGESSPSPIKKTRQSSSGLALSGSGDHTPTSDAAARRKSSVFGKSLQSSPSGHEDTNEEPAKEDEEEEEAPPVKYTCKGWGFCKVPAWLTPYCLSGSNIFVSAGGGMTVLYFSLFMKDTFGASPVVLQLLNASVTIMTVLLAEILALADSRGVNRFFLQVPPTVIGVCGSLLLATIDSGAVATLWGTFVLFTFRMSMMSCNVGLIRALMMDLVNPAQRARWNALESLASAMWAASAAGGGYIIDSAGYRKSFLITFCIHIIALGLLVVIMRNKDPKDEDYEEETALIEASSNDDDADNKEDKAELLSPDNEEGPGMPRYPPAMGDSTGSHPRQFRNVMGFTSGSSSQQSSFRHTDSHGPPGGSAFAGSMTRPGLISIFEGSGNRSRPVSSANSPGASQTSAPHAKSPVPAPQIAVGDTVLMVVPPEVLMTSQASEAAS